jgi:hypothetical protein
MDIINFTKSYYSRNIFKNWNTPIKKLNNTDIICHLVQPEHQFPDDLFSLEERKNGAILVHFLAFIYAISKLIKHCYLFQ